MAEWERPQHSIQIASAFAIGKYEVTKDQFAAFINNSGYDGGSKCSGKIGWSNPPEQTGHYFRNVGFPQTGNEPAVCVSWTDARAYVEWLSKQTGKKYRLPSEAEWEYAARAGSLSRLVAARSTDEICQYANVNDLSHIKANPDRSPSKSNANCSDGYAYTSPVGSFPPNAWGLFDMLGNATEWVEDCFHQGYLHAPPDGSAWIGCSAVAGHMQRGGSFESDVQFVRPASRWALNGELPETDSGFRVVRSLAP